jgi:4-hydroxy-tetrahydrodipicolinate reductase
MKKALCIALIGYGKMGKEIEKIILERGHSVSAIIDAGDSLSELSLTSTDVAIEFTRPDVAVNNIKKCMD